MAEQSPEELAAIQDAIFRVTRAWRTYEGIHGIDVDKVEEPSSSQGLGDEVAPPPSGEYRPLDDEDYRQITQELEIEISAAQGQNVDVLNKIAGDLAYLNAVEQRGPMSHEAATPAREVTPEARAMRDKAIAKARKENPLVKEPDQSSGVDYAARDVESALAEFAGVRANGGLSQTELELAAKHMNLPDDLKADVEALITAMEKKDYTGEWVQPLGNIKNLRHTFESAHRAHHDPFSLRATDPAELEKFVVATRYLTEGIEGFEPTTDGSWEKQAQAIRDWLVGDLEIVSPSEFKKHEHSQYADALAANIKAKWEESKNDATPDDQKAIIEGHLDAFLKEMGAVFLKALDIEISSGKDLPPGDIHNLSKKFKKASLDAPSLENDGPVLKAEAPRYELPGVGMSVKV